MMTGNYDAVLALLPAFEAGVVPELAEPMAGALAASARARAEQAQTAPDAERAELLRQAQDLAKRAEAIRPGITRGGA